MSGLDRLRVTLKITNEEKPFLFPIRHSLDLYHHKHTQELAENISNQLEITLEKAKQNLNYLTGSLEEYRESRLEALKTPIKKKQELTNHQRSQALEYLKQPKLLAQTQVDIESSGMIGEKVNSLIALLIYTSRKREKPLHLMCLGASGTGKTHLQEKISDCIPEEEKIEITTLSENAFYYFGKQELKGKLLLIEDLDGAQDVLYPLRELQSKRKISKTVTLKDSKGNLKTQTLVVEGPVCVSGCTTREKLYEDNANRCLLLYIDQSKRQDQQIMNYQKMSSAGQINHELEEDAKLRLQHARENEESERLAGNRLTAVRHYYQYLQYDNNDQGNPAEKLFVRQTKKYLVHDVLAKEQLIELYQNYPNESLREKRNKIILGILVHQGLRKEEIPLLKIHHLQLREGKFIVPPNNLNNGRTIKLASDQILDLQEYLLVVRPQILKEMNVPKPSGLKPKYQDANTDQLFISMNGSLQMKASLYHLMRSLRKEYEELKGCLQIRMSVITHWLKEKDIREVQYLGGFRHLDSLEYYQKYHTEELEAELKKYHPLK